jgi:hypothetical protein
MIEIDIEIDEGCSVMSISVIKNRQTEIDIKTSNVRAVLKLNLFFSNGN